MSGVEEDCPICNATPSAKEQFARGKVAEHVKQKARRHETHREWIAEHTEHGTLAEIRAALRRTKSPDNPS